MIFLPAKGQNIHSPLDLLESFHVSAQSNGVTEKGEHA